MFLIVCTMFFAEIKNLTANEVAKNDILDTVPKSNSTRVN